MNQPSLAFTADKAATDHGKAQVMTILADGGWHTRKEIERLTGLNERAVRLVAEHSNGAILSGDRGYKLQHYATTAEYFEWENRMRSQAKTMLRRIVQARRARNRGVAA